MAGHPAPPRIDVEISPVDNSEHTSATPNHAENLSPSMLQTPHENGRDRAFSALSGSTQFSTLKIPQTSGGEKSIASSVFSGDDREDALRPDPGSERDFQVTDNKFAFSPGQLNKLLNPKSLPAYAALGGIRGIERGLRTNLQTGLNADESVLSGKVSFEQATKANGSNSLGWDEVPLPPADYKPAGTSGNFTDRTRVYSNNALPEKKPTPLWKLVWMAYNDKILILLTVAAAISLALGLYETFGKEHEPGDPMPVDWIEGCAICVAIIVVVLVGSLNDYQKERAFVKLNAKKDDRMVKILRSGKSIMINVVDIMAGDVLHLEPGDMIPVDGIFISGHGVKCDESSATGESDALKKVGGEQVMRMIEEGHHNLKDMDCFIISGSKVLEGIGTYVATSVGVNSSYGKILMSMRVDMAPTPLQVKLDGLATAIAKLGTSAALLLFFVLLFRFAAGLSSNPRSSSDKASQFLDILIVAVTVIVVAVPEGLPLAVTLALAFATTQLVKQNNLVRILKSCETMGNATTVCSDKTGTLTTNVMTVVTGAFGPLSFDDKNQTGNEVRTSEFVAQLSNEERRRLIEAITINSTAFETDEGFVGSKTETALLSFARALGMGPLGEERSNCPAHAFYPFDSGRKCMGAVQKLSDGRFRLVVKGASEILLGHSTHIATSSGLQPLDGAQRESIESLIDTYAKQSLRTIALISREFPQWPPAGCTAENDPNEADFGLLLNNMTFDGLVGIQDPVRPGVPEAVAKLTNRAGVTVRMVTGDNVVTAKAIATECGIYTDGIVMEGPVFRGLNQQQMNDILPKLQVLARSSPEDKRILVTSLRALGEIVAVTGDGTNDGPALKAADIGFSMGIAGTEVAKEASSIILMDDNFASILTALMWGRAVNDAVRKFLQFQLTVNVAAVIITFVSAVANEGMRSVLVAVQLLWINLIMDSMAALTLASDAPTEEILDRTPAKRSAPLISISMWKMIIGQAIFQMGASFILYYAGPDILNYEYDGDQIRSVVFNTFVWMQIFNMFNSRVLGNSWSRIFVGIHRNYYFMVVTAIMIGCQVMIMFVGSTAFQIVSIDAKDWGISIVIGALSLPWAVVVRLFPDGLFEKIAKFCGYPVVLVYRPMSRWTHALSRKIRSLRRKRPESQAVEEMAEAEAQRDFENDKVQDPEKGRV